MWNYGEIGELLYEMKSNNKKIEQLAHGRLFDLSQRRQRRGRLQELDNNRLR